MQKKDVSITVKMPSGLLERINRELDIGEYTSRSDLIKVAVRMHLQYLEETRVSNSGEKAMSMKKEEQTSSGRT